ncbi:MAG: NAD(P)-dependent oxidoreductase [Planctomycetes bacterium]|nr:NAD(P)-dependent oxidoreductase [Planctomycetota bacterium]
MRVAILGLGIIGEVWARNLLADGIAVAPWNRSAKPIPGFVADAREAAREADVVIVVVADPPAVDGVLAQIEPVLRAGQVVVQSSTISPEWTKRFAARVAGRGAAYLDAPFTGSKLAAIARETVYYVGGEAAVLERVRPVLARLSKAIVHAGAIGDASSVKLAMNINIALVGAALAESLSFARAAGVSDDMFFAALKLNASRSGVSDLKEPKLRAGDFAPQFSLKHMDKDLRLALETVGESGLPALRRVKAVYDQGMEAGWGDQDFSCLVRLVGAQASGAPAAHG